MKSVLVVLAVVVAAVLVAAVLVAAVLVAAVLVAAVAAVLDIWCAAHSILFAHCIFGPLHP